MNDLEIINLNNIDFSIETKGKINFNIEKSVNKIDFDIELLLKGDLEEVTTEEYMRLSDYMQNVPNINENNYSQKDINRVSELIKLYTELGSESNG